jgi:hypothetical protein
MKKSGTCIRDEAVHFEYLADALPVRAWLVSGEFTYLGKLECLGVLAADDCVRHRLTSAAAGLVSEARNKALSSSYITILRCTPKTRKLLSS